MSVLSELKLDQLMRYGYGGVLLIFFAYIFRPDIVGTMIESLGAIFTPIAALGLGVTIYTINRFVIGELVIYRIIDCIDYNWDTRKSPEELFLYRIIHWSNYKIWGKIKRKLSKDSFLCRIIHWSNYKIWGKIRTRPDTNVTASMTRYLESLGVNKRNCIGAYTAVRRKLSDPDQREKFDIAHAKLHILWITIEVFLLIYFYMYLTQKEPQIFSSIVKPLYLLVISLVLIFSAIVVEIHQLRYECHIFKLYEEESNEVTTFLTNADYK